MSQFRQVLQERQQNNEEEISSSSKVQEVWKVKESVQVLMKKTAQKKKVAKVMKEFKAGTLNSGSSKGPIVKNKKQAVAIALASAKMSNKKMGKKK